MTLKIFNTIILTIGFSLLSLSKSVAAETYYTINTSSPKGNYLMLYQRIADQNVDSLLYNATASFIIERRVYDPSNPNANSKYKRIGTAQCVQSVSELKTYFTTAQIESLQQNYKLAAEKDVLDFMKQHNYPKDFGPFYVSLEFQQALGHLYIDTDIKEGAFYQYKIIRVDKNNTQLFWSTAIVESKAENIYLKHFKPFFKSISVSDSAVAFKWQVLIPKNLVAKIERENKNKSNYVSDSTLYGKYIPLPATFNAKIFTLNDGRWEFTETQMASANREQDTLTFYFRKKVLPHQLVAAFIQLEDMVHNEGLYSDTAYSYAINTNTIPLLRAIQVEDIIDGIKISWSPLPKKPYILGVQLYRYNSQDIIDTLAIISLRDSVYYDYNIKVGQTYRYKAKAVFIPQINLVQEHPAEGVGAFTQFTNPLPPSNLIATQEGKNISLNWEYSDHPSFYGFYVYRGTTPQNMSLISIAVKEKTFLDTASSLSGRSSYYYTVVAQNLRQDTSIYSNVEHIQSNKKIEITYPKDIKCYYENGKLHLLWKDVRQSDNLISYYVVQKKKKNEAQYKTITAPNFAFNMMIDSNIQAGEDNLYRVASISKNGDTSQFSEASQYTLPKSMVDLIDLFYARNLKNSIEVSLPAIIYNDRKSYNIYRRTEDQNEFTKINTIDADHFMYEDLQVQSKTMYIYAVTVTHKDGREGQFGKSVSVRKF